MVVQRVGVIGAGAAGLVACRHLVADTQHFVCEVFEQTGSVGGTWVYTDTIGQNEFGLPVHSSMYKNLRTNLPKQTMEFPDYPIPEQDRSYLPAEQVLQYLNDYADHFNVRRHIRFYQHVKTVSPKEGGGWILVATDLKSREDKTFEFDAIMICNGHYFKPSVPDLPGAETFPGQILHSHDYRDGVAFSGKNVVVVGAGFSGVDIALLIAQAGARSVVLSHRNPEPIRITTFSDKLLRQAPLVTRIAEDLVEFADGTTFKADVIVYCTGYQYSFPFLRPESLVRVEDNCVQPLYKHLVHIDYPTMALVGLPFRVCANPLYDLQVRFFLRTLTGEVSLPSRADMIKETEADMEKRKSAGLGLRKAHMMLGPMQGEYFSELAALGGLQPLPPVLPKLHIESIRRFHEDVARYREDKFLVIDSENFVTVNRDAQVC